MPRANPEYYRFQKSIIFPEDMYEQVEEVARKKGWSFTKAVVWLVGDALRRRAPRRGKEE